MSEKTEFFKIPQIQIGNGPAGRAYGGLIYSSTLEVGVNGEATKLTLNIVPDDAGGDIQISSDNLTDQNRTQISIGGHISMENMILTSYSKAKSVEDKTLSLEYSDGSILFDKVYVGLMNRHYQAETRNEHEYTIEFDALCNSRHGTSSKVPPELLGQCDGKDLQLISTMARAGLESYGAPQNAKEHWTRKGDMPEWTENGAIIKRTYVKAGDKKKNYQIFTPSRFTGGKMEEKLDSAWDGDLFDGALVVLGREEFKESVCDASMDVSYNFSDLLSAMKAMGIVISKALDEDGVTELAHSSLFDKNKTYLKSYAGTLREVLQQWCSDFGFGFHWDFRKKIPTIVGVDLTGKGNVNLETVEGVINGGESKTVSGGKAYVIESSEENVSLDETYQQVYVSQYLKGAKQRENTHKSITQDYFTNVDFMRLLGVGDVSNRGKPNWNPSILYRTAVEFMISCGLSKFNKNLRTLFNIRLAIDHSQKATGDYSKFLPLGITGVIPLTWTPFPKSSTRVANTNDWTVITETIDWDSHIDLSTLVVKGKGVDILTGHTAFLGVYDADMEARFEQLEDVVANFWGTMYRTGNNYNAEHWECSNTHRRHENVQYDPPAQFASIYEEHSLDEIRNILQNVNHLLRGDEFGTDFMNELEETQRQIVQACKSSEKQRKEQGFYWLKRDDAQWGTQQGDVNDMVNPWVMELDMEAENSSTGGRKRQDINAPYMPKPIELPGLAKQIILSDTKIDKNLRNMLNSARGTVYLFMVPGVVAGEFFSPSPGKSVHLRNRKIDVRDLGQVYIGNSWLTKTLPSGFETVVQNFRRSFPCYSGTSVQEGSVYAPTGKEVDCTGAIGDIQATGYHKHWVARNVMEELSLLRKLCEKDKMEEDKSEAECRTKCDRSLLEDACGKCAEDEVDFPDKFTNTLVSTREGYIFCDSFNLIRKNKRWDGHRGTGTPLLTQDYFYSDDEFNGSNPLVADKLKAVKIIFPSRNAHGTIRTFTSKKTSISQGAKLVLGGKLKKNPARRLKFLEQNITSDLEQFYEGRADGTQRIIDGRTPWTPEQIRILSLTSGSDPDNPIRTAYLKDYHDFLEENLNIQVLEPVKTLSFKLVMGKSLPESVTKILNVRNGLNSLSYSLDANGFSMDINFSNKPPVLPELAVTMRNLGPAMTNNNSMQSQR